MLVVLFVFITWAHFPSWPIRDVFIWLVLYVRFETLLIHSTLHFLAVIQALAFVQPLFQPPVAPRDR
jgi:hypothetical protein